MAVVDVDDAAARAVLNNRYGFFDPVTLEYIVADVLTPRPWVNVMANERYGLVISQLGGGFSWAGNCQFDRITRWDQDLASDPCGRWLYVADLDSGEIQSTSFAPVRVPAAQESVRHGLGYSVFERSFWGIESSQIIFVPLEGACEHWIVELKNTSDRPRSLLVGSFLDLHLGNHADWHREFHRLFVTVEAQEDTLFAWKRTGLEHGSRVPPGSPMAAFVSVTGLQGVEWFTDKADWLGREGRMDRPRALVEDVAPRSTGRWDDPIAAFRTKLTLEAGQSIRFGVTIGAEPSVDASRSSARVDLSTIDKRFEQTKVHHRDRAGELRIESGDPAFDLMNNGWLPHQAEVGRMIARCAYYQQGGAYGFRDQLQDSLCLLDTDPARTLAQLQLHAEAMYEDGGVRHWWFPDAPVFVESHHSDTCLWLAFGLLEYLDETADLSALDLPLRFLSRQTQAFASSGTMLEHAQRGIGRFLERRSARGLPLIGAGDWNDGLSHAGIDGKGESVWLAMFGFHILKRMAQILSRLGRTHEAQRYQEESEALRVAVESHGWDGAWYIAGTSDNGRPFGSRSNSEGQIFLNPQTWAVITGIASPERAARALQSAKERLVKPYGALLLHPAYQQVDPYIGYITRYAPGLRENGGVYSHASTWAVQAFAMAGDVETAYAIYRGMLPPLRAALDADGYQAEPYVMPGNVDGPDSPFEGRAGWTWYTGSAAWMRRVALRWILGVRASFEELEVEPSLPDGLGPVRLVRPFRGERYSIEIGPDGAEASTAILPRNS